MVGLGGLEPPTSRLSGGRSNRLSYRPGELTSAMRALISTEDLGSSFALACIEVEDLESKRRNTPVSKN